MEKIFDIIEKSLQEQDFNKEMKKELKFELKKKNYKQEDFNFILNHCYNLIKDKEDNHRFTLQLNWLKQINDILNNIKPQTQTNNNIVCFSPRNNCNKVIVDFLDKAKNNIAICVFTISDNLISRKIMECHKKGIKIKIISDNDKVFDKGSDIQEITSFRIPVKIDHSQHHMHHKFAIVDKKTLLTGSYNWTRSAEEYNQENFIITENKQLVKTFQKEFDKLWEQMDSFNLS